MDIIQDDKWCKGKTTVEAGFFIRRSFRRFLMTEKAKKSFVKINWEEDKGMFNSLFLINVTGKKRYVEKWLTQLKEW